VITFRSISGKPIAPDGGAAIGYSNFSQQLHLVVVIDLGLLADGFIVNYPFGKADGVFHLYAKSSMIFRFG